MNVSSSSREISLILLLLVVRVMLCGVSGPFIDESYYAVAWHFGNTHYLTADYRMWPMITWVVNQWGGIEAMRCVAALFGVATVVVAIRYSKVLLQVLGLDDERGSASLWAAFAFGISGPALFTSTFAGYDSLAQILLALAFLFLLQAGSVDQSPRWLVVAAALVTASFASRYFLLIYMPGALLAGAFFACRGPGGIKRSILWFVIPLAGFFGAYWALNESHISASFFHARWLSSQIDSGRTPGSVFSDSFRRMWPIWVLAGSGLILAFPKVRSSQLRFGLLVIFGSIFTVVAYHMYHGNVYALSRNLAFGAFLAAPLSGYALAEIVQRGVLRVRGLIVAIIAVTVMTYQGVALTLQDHRAWLDTRPFIHRLLTEVDLKPGDLVYPLDPVANPWEIYRVLTPLGINVRQGVPWEMTQAAMFAEKKARVIVGVIDSAETQRAAVTNGYRELENLSHSPAQPVRIFLRAE